MIHVARRYIAYQATFNWPLAPSETSQKRHMMLYIHLYGTALLATQYSYLLAKFLSNISPQLAIPGSSDQ